MSQPPPKPLFTIVGTPAELPSSGISRENGWEKPVASPGRRRQERSCRREGKSDARRLPAEMETFFPKRLRFMAMTTGWAKQRNEARCSQKSQNTLSGFVSWSRATSRSESCCKLAQIPKSWEICSHVSHSVGHQLPLPAHHEPAEPGPLRGPVHERLRNTSGF